MMRCWLPAIALFAIAAKAQSLNFTDVPHIHTALNHLTVIDVGEPIQFIAAANPDAFQIERAGDRVLLQPTKESVSTNLILWTASRQLSYELDAPGPLTQLNVLVRNLPASAKAAADGPMVEERERIATAATAKAMLNAQDVIREKQTKESSGVQATIVRVLHTSHGTYIEYEVANHSATPFRVTTPSVTRLVPTVIPTSLLALRNHELTSQALSAFQAKPDGTAPATSGESKETDVQPGASTSGYVLVSTFPDGVPEIYQLRFGYTSSFALVDTVVI